MTLQRSRLWPRGQRQTFFNTFKLGKNGQAIGMGYSIDEKAVSRVSLK